MEADATGMSKVFRCSSLCIRCPWSLQMEKLGASDEKKGGTTPFITSVRFAFMGVKVLLTTCCQEI